MFFNSFIFLIFLFIVIPLYYLFPPRQRNPLLLVASYFFYGYWDWRFCFLLLLSTIIDFIIGSLIYCSDNETKRRVLLFFSLFINLGILGFFKYFNFFVDSFTRLSNLFGIKPDFLHLNIILPVGISFYTFQTLSYTIDIYRKKLAPERSFINYAVFVAFFPQLVAGPIERATNLLPQIRDPKKATSKQFHEGICLIIFGLFKKVMIGDTCGRFVDHIFTNIELYKSVELISALILFSLQIYADFSGYSSIARGTAKLLGKELMVNFNQPYLSESITEFWHRWHISLSTWLRDYLYIPLGGNRKGKSRTYINLMLTMFLGGLWHGASWTFAIWGGLHGLYLAVHKMVTTKKGTTTVTNNKENIIVGITRRIINIAGTYILVSVTWLFFRITNFSDVFVYIRCLIHWTPSEFTGIFTRITLTYLAVVIVIDLFERKMGELFFLPKLKMVAVQYSILFTIAIITLAYMFQTKPMPFVYFQF